MKVKIASIIFLTFPFHHLMYLSEWNNWSAPVR